MILKEKNLIQIKHANDIFVIRNGEKIALSSYETLKVGAFYWFLKDHDLKIPPDHACIDLVLYQIEPNNDNSFQVVKKINKNKKRKKAVVTSRRNSHTPDI